MAKQKKEPVRQAQGKTKEKPIEVSLWDAANKLRGSVEPAEYKHVVLGLIFLKFASDKFEAHRAKLIAEGKEKYLEMADFYNMSNVFFLEETSRWSYLIKRAKQNDIALLIDTALHTIEKNNKTLRGALPDNYFSRLGLDVSKLASLLDTINDIDTTKDPKQDLVGKVYEYFLSKFALAEGKGKGEFYTPKSIVNLIAEMIEPYKGIIYDPACGSGGMFVQSVKFIEAHHGNKKEVSIYGQEYTNTTYKLAKMNLAIRGISGNLGEKAANTFLDDQHKDLKADFIMANPPFNQKDWRAENELIDDPRWRGYDVPPKSNANYGWILNMVSKLSDNGVAGFILANGALSGGGEEYKIRRKLIENNLVEAILVLPRNLFYTTDISVTLWIVNKNKKAQSKKVGDETRNFRNREKEILFMDLRQMGIPFEKKYTQFSDEDIQKVVSTYHQWQTATMVNDQLVMVNEEMAEDVNTASITIAQYKDIPEFCYSASFDEIAKKDFSLVPSKYIAFVNRDENINFDDKMKNLQTEFAELLQAEEKSKQELLKVFENLGYSIDQI
jgi:type I restriction enzyme M protein